MPADVLFSSEWETGWAWQRFTRQADDGTFVAGDAFYVRFRFGLTINANGTVTADFFDFTIDCR